jgi:hypothetical protein
MIAKAIESSHKVAELKTTAGFRHRLEFRAFPFAAE